MAAALDGESLFGTMHEDVEYKLRITDVKDSLLRVASFEATEMLSELFSYAICVGTDPDEVEELEKALGRDAAFAIEHDGKIVRIVHGIITDVAPDGTFVGKTQARVVFVLEPRMANLQHGGGFRVFQNKAVHEIVGEIFKSEQIECLWHVLGKPPKREYCTQFDETDLEFVARITSEEGLHFYFKHDEKKTTVVFTNEPQGYEEIEPKIKISFNDVIGAVTGEHVRTIRRTQSIRPGAFEHRDYNFLEPLKGLVARAETQGQENTGNSHKREIRDYPGSFIDKDGVGKKLAQRRLEEWRSDAFVLAGTASSLRFAPGKTFTLQGHKNDGFNRKLLLTFISLQGVIEGAKQGGGFRANTALTHFSAVPADITIHPKRGEKPASRLQSARVVGLKDGDPYVDDHGRVKVQFFWDREGTFDERSSCWIRMMTPVAHRDEGFWQAHKVGSEVLVDFVDGDIDRPIVLGAVYNTAQSQTYALPAQVAKSVWRTNSIPGNAGHNEITHVNTAGNEQIYLHAQKDLKEVVLHDHTENIGANQSSTIGAAQTIHVGATRSLTVTAKDTIKLLNESELRVTGFATEEFKAGHKVRILGGAGEDVYVEQNKTEHIEQNKTEHIEQTYDLTTDVKFKLTQGKATITVEGNIITLETPAAIVLKVGETRINIGPESILQLSKLVAAHGDDSSMVVKGGSAVLMSNGKVELEGKEEVSVKAEGEVAIKGKEIKLNS